LGLTQDQLKSNEIIQKLLENHSVQVNTLVESHDHTQRIKIRNFQALIDNNYSHKNPTQKSIDLQDSDFIRNNFNSMPSSANLIDSEEPQFDQPKEQVSLNLRISRPIFQNLSDHAKGILQKLGGSTESDIPNVMI
jgi:hypothetical protein